MMKRCLKWMGIGIGLMALLWCFPLSAGAVTAREGGEADLYRRQYQESGADDLADALPEITKDILDTFGLDLENPEAETNIKWQNLFEVIGDFLSTGMKGPFSLMMAVIGVLLIFTAAEGCLLEGTGEGISTRICLLACLSLLQPVYQLVGSLQQTLQQVSHFMMAFVPVYAGLLASGGRVDTAGGFASLMLAAVEGISYFISYGFVPMVGGCMSLSVCGCLSPVGGMDRLAEWVKKAAIFVMGIFTTAFLGVLSVQTTLTAASENVGIRTSKAVIAGSIPVMGTAIAETLNTARGCLALLRSGVGIYGVLAVVLLGLPIAIELLLFRVGMWICSGAAELFGMGRVGRLFTSLDFFLSTLLGAICFIGLLFILSLTIVMQTGGAFS